MNKPLQKATLILMLAFLLFPLMRVDAQTPSQSAQDIVQMKATVVKVAGDARIRNRGKIFWHDAKVNEILSAGDQIETKANGKIEIKLDNNNVINLRPKTKLILRKLTSNLKTGDYENLLESNIGKIRAKVEKIKGNSKFEIKTPTAVACVRGTITYLLVYPDSTMVFFEEGIGFVTNPFSGQTFDVEPGNVYQIDENGNVTGPVIPTSEQLQDIIEGWNVGPGAEGYTEPGGEEGGAGGGDDLGDETDDLTEGQQDSQDEAQDDRQNSQNTELTEYQGSGLLGGTTTSGETGTTTETDTDGDGYLDTIDTFPLDPREWTDVDSDGVGDNEDAFNNTFFPNDPEGNPLDPLIYGSRDSIRQRIKDIIDRDNLRTELQNMIDDTNIRHLDAQMTQIADAQTGKILTDRQGNRVRIEQYVLRPRSDTVEVLNVNLRTAGEHAGLSTLDWTTRFGGQNLDSFTGAQLRALPWNDYLEAPRRGNDLVGRGPRYSSEPSHYPTFMSVELKNPTGNAFYEERALNAPRQTESGWTQRVTRDQIRVNGGELQNFTIDRSFSSERGNPNGFTYNPAGSGKSDIIEFNFYVISDDPNVGRLAIRGKNFNNMWEALAVNMDGVPNRMNIGNRNLEIRISGSAYAKDIDLIYVPFTRLDWNDSHDWLNEEGPR